jgi:hypothetical protein
MGVIPLQVKAMIAILLMTSIFWAGWMTKGWKVDSAVLANQVRVAKDVKVAVAKDRVQVASTQEKAVETKIIYRDIIKEITRETNDNDCFGAGAARVWNAALNATRPVPEITAGVTRTSGTTAGTEKVEAEFTDKEILNNHAINAEIWKSHRDRLEAIREWDRRNFSESIPND